MKYSFLIKYMLSFLAVLLCFSSTTLTAQLNTGGQPYSFSNELRDNTPLEVMPPIDLAALKREDEQDEASNLPYRFGYGFKTNFNLENSGVWTVLANGDRIWRLRIECPGAKSINLTYDSFWLPKGAVFYIYSPDQSEILGGFTAKNNKGSKAERKGFATSFIKQDQIILEYYEPAKEIGNGIISINKIVHGYRTVRNNNRDFGDSGSCNVNINCSEGDDYQDEKRAVALIIIDGILACSGALVTNTCQNSAPFFLTADHCFDPYDYDDDALTDYAGHDAITNPDGSAFMFLWNYESNDCNNGSGFTPPSTTGATMLANANVASSDFALLFLAENPANLPGVDPFYLGWDRAGTTPGGGVCIHHPKGDIKKFSEEEQSLSSTNRSSNPPNPSGNYWRVEDWDIGVTEVGSSGSPLMIPGTNLVVGILSDGDAACNGGDDNGLSDWYGKFSVAWDNNGATDSRRRLRDWLGACNSNIVVMGGMDGPEPCTPDLTLNGMIGSGTYGASNSITSAAIIPTSAVVDYSAGSFIDLTPGFNTESGVDFVAQILPCTRSSATNDGTRRNMRASLPYQSNTDNSFNSYQLKVYPNPTSSNTTVEFTLSQANVVDIRVVDITGKTIQTVSSNQGLSSGTHQMVIDGSALHSGVYFIYLKIENEMPLIEKLIVN